MGYGALEGIERVLVKIDSLQVRMTEQVRELAQPGLAIQCEMGPVLVVLGFPPFQFSNQILSVLNRA